MRQLAIYLTRVQPAKLNITWGSLASIFSLDGSRRFLERAAESARLRVTSLTRSVTLCARPSVNVERRVVGASDSARDILCLPIRNIANTSASRYIVANC